jgi:prophage regulatory protein
MQAKLIRLDEVIDVTGLSRSHLYHLISQGLFPTQINLCGGRAVAWVESEVQAWIDSRIEASRNGGGV